MEDQWLLKIAIANELVKREFISLHLTKSGMAQVIVKGVQALTSAAPAVTSLIRPAIVGGAKAGAQVAGKSGKAVSETVSRLKNMRSANAATSAGTRATQTASKTGTMAAKPKPTSLLAKSNVQQQTIKKPLGAPQSTVTPGTALGQQGGLFGTSPGAMATGPGAGVTKIVPPPGAGRFGTVQRQNVMMAKQPLPKPQPVTAPYAQGPAGAPGNASALGNPAQMQLPGIHPGAGMLTREQALAQAAEELAAKKMGWKKQLGLTAMMFAPGMIESSSRGGLPASDWDMG